MNDQSQLSPTRTNAEPAPPDFAPMSAQELWDGVRSLELHVLRLQNPHHDIPMRDRTKEQKRLPRLSLATQRKIDALWDLRGQADSALFNRNGFEVRVPTRDEQDHLVEKWTAHLKEQLAPR